MKTDQGKLRSRSVAPVVAVPPVGKGLATITGGLVVVVGLVVIVGLVVVVVVVAGLVMLGRSSAPEAVTVSPASTSSAPVNSEPHPPSCTESAPATSIDESDLNDDVFISVSPLGFRLRLRLRTRIEQRPDQHETRASPRRL